MIDKNSLKEIVEAILFVSEKPLNSTEVLKILLSAEISPLDSSEQSKSTRSDIQKMIE